MAVVYVVHVGFRFIPLSKTPFSFTFAEKLGQLRLCPQNVIEIRLSKSKKFVKCLKIQREER